MAGALRSGGQKAAETACIPMIAMTDMEKAPILSAASPAASNSSASLHTAGRDPATWQQAALLTIHSQPLHPCVVMTSLNWSPPSICSKPWCKQQVRCGREGFTHLAAGHPVYHTQPAPAGRCLARLLKLPAQGLQVMKLAAVLVQTCRAHRQTKTSRALRPLPYDGKPLRFVTGLLKEHLGCQLWGSQLLSTLWFT